MINILRGEPGNGYVDAAKHFLSTILTSIEGLDLYPRLNLYRDIVLLSLFDKAFTTSKSVVLLAEQGSGADAFGLSRTVIEAFLSLRYVANRDSERRAKRYVTYFGKDKEILERLIREHHPQLIDSFPEEHQRMLEMAKDFKSPHKWFEEGVQLKDVAVEPSSRFVGANGSPETWKYTYDVVYRYTSHEVHATSIAQYARIAEFFKYGSRPGPFRFSKPQAPSDAANGVFNACLHLQAALIELLYAFGQVVPSDVVAAYEAFLTALIGAVSPLTPEEGYAQ